MSQTSPVRVVQCPKCGSPVQGHSASGYITCTFCGASLQLIEGASGHAMARLAGIETSTLYLAKTEALKELRVELEEMQAWLDKWCQLRDLLDHWVGTHRPNWLSANCEKREYQERQAKLEEARTSAEHFAAECSRLEQYIRNAQTELREMAKRL